MPARRPRPALRCVSLCHGRTVTPTCRCATAGPAWPPGPGGAPGAREQIFGRLVRLEGNRNGAGAGLGLPIARGIARAHGGDVTCEPTAPGAGAVFVLRLPTE